MSKLMYYAGIMQTQKRLLTGVQPSGRVHIGNYFGAIKPAVDRLKDFESFLMVADLHALTTVRDASALRQYVVDVVKDYLAVGVDPEEVTLFRQSDIPAHAELAWIFDCLVSVSFLEQAHAYKDKVAKGLEANAGLFNYPMLMAADILLYDAHFVPVGRDNQQHIEYAREAARKFHLAYGDMFVEPEAIIDQDVAIVPGTDGQKMSKSYGNTIPLFATREEIQKAVMSIVTDSSGDTPMNVYNIHKLVRTEAELAPIYAEHKGKYKALKDILIEDLDAMIAPLRERRAAITDEVVAEVLERGAARARAIAEPKIAQIRKAVGLR